MLSGVLLIDKPPGPTSHDVVARLRRTSGERRIGHTGTLDPRASGLLVLVLGSATRLASLFSGSDKTYEAVIALGVATDTDDAEGAPRGAPATVLPGVAAIDAALGEFRGTFAQLPPRHSAKKIGGEKAYELARRAEPVLLQPVQVTVHDMARTGFDGARLALHIVAGAGFYVRALARDLGERLGCGAHLAELRRTRVGPFSVDDAVPLADAEAVGREIRARVLPPVEALPHLPAVVVTEAGVRRVRHGNPIGPEHLARHWLPAPTEAPLVRVLEPGGTLLAVAGVRGGALHPSIVLGE